MPTKPAPSRIPSWSYSRYSTYGQCPAKAKFLYVDKKKEPDSPAGLKGTRIHAIAALVATGKLPAPDRDNAALMPELRKLLTQKAMPPELVTFKKEFAALRRAGNVLTEQEWAFTLNWEPTGWFDANCWLRIKVDAHWVEQVKKGTLRKTHVQIVDHKSGKIYDSHKEQRSLYALGAFLRYPEAASVTAAHWYLELGEEHKDAWEARELPALKAEWLRRTTAMLNDTTYAPRPGDYCKYCHFRKANGGPCVY